MLVLPARVASTVQRRFAAIAGLAVVPTDTLQPGQVPGADICLVHESCDDADAIICDLTERAGLRVIVLGDSKPSSRHALHYIDAGADDYLSSDVTAAEWVARLRAVMRRAPAPSHPGRADLCAGDVAISFLQRQVWRGGNVARLTHIEFSLLEILARHIDTPVPYARLIAEVWGVEHLTARHYLRVYIRRLREKLEADPPNPRLITTEARAGYMLRSVGAAQPQPPGAPAMALHQHADDAALRAAP